MVVLVLGYDTTRRTLTTMEVRLCGERFDPIVLDGHIVRRAVVTNLPDRGGEPPTNALRLHAQGMTYYNLGLVAKLS